MCVCVFFFLRSTKLCYSSTSSTVAIAEHHQSFQCFRLHFFFFLTSQQQQYRRPCTASSALAIQVRTMWGTVSSQRCFRKDWIYYFSTLDTRPVNMPAHGVFDLVVSQMSQQFWSNIFDYTVKTLNKIKLFI